MLIDLPTLTQGHKELTDLPTLTQGHKVLTDLLTLTQGHKELPDLLTLTPAIQPRPRLRVNGRDINENDESESSSRENVKWQISEGH